jgi:hypothetical protein
MFLLFVVIVMLGLFALIGWIAYLERRLGKNDL